MFKQKANVASTRIRQSITMRGKSTRCVLSDNRKLYSPVDRCHYWSIRRQQRVLCGPQSEARRHNWNVMVTPNRRYSHEQLIFSSTKNFIFFFLSYRLYTEAADTNPRGWPWRPCVGVEAARASWEFFQVANCTCVLHSPAWLVHINDSGPGLAFHSRRYSPYGRDAQIFHASKTHLKFLGVKSVLISTFHTEDRQTLGATVRNSVDTATWRPRFVYPCNVVSQHHARTIKFSDSHRLLYATVQP
jgi:hypothetical protein